jgi:nucleotide-binding universal stress UspA family protein
MYRDILVHLDGGPRDALLVNVARALAERHAGRLTGLFARRSSEELEAAANASEAAFTKATRDGSIRVRWKRLPSGSPFDIIAEMAASARFYDLVVMGQHHEDKPSPADLGEQVILQSGRPVLVIPAVGEYPTIGTNVLVAWNGGREASRAMHDALPLLAKAASVGVLTVLASDQKRNEHGLSGTKILDHLAVHGITISREILVKQEIGVMDLILSRSFELGADLLVMGAHGGSHLTLSRGAGTQHVIDHMTLPVLFSQ